MKVKVQLKNKKQQKINKDAYCREKIQFYIGNKVQLPCADIKTIFSCDELDYYRLR